MSERSHVGLIELCSLSSSVKSLLGPLKSYKFIYDQDTQQSTLTCSSFRLLESLNLTSAVGQHLYEAIHIHQKTYKTGVTTLVFLVGAWSKAVLGCLQQGVPVPLIVSVMLEALNSCIDIAECFHIKIDNVLINNQKSDKLTSLREETVCIQCRKSNCVSCSNHPVTSGSHHGNHLHRNRMETHSRPTHAGDFLGKTCHMNKLSHSRHFSVPNRSCFHSSGSTLPTNNHTLRDLTQSLSHGNSETMNLVEEAVQLLCESAQTTSINKDLFQASQLELCVLKGQTDALSNALFGYATLVPAENYELIKRWEGKALKLLLLDGELTEKYRHLGFNKATNVNSISQFKSTETTQHDHSWTSTACRTFCQAGIDIILVRGDVCPQLMMQCRQKHILIIPHVRQNVLEAFCECTGAEPVTYLAQISCHSIGGNVSVTVYTVLECDQKLAIILQAPRLNFVTAVVSCRLLAKEQALEDQFWACCHRLHHAINEQKVLPGGGAVELLCLSHLRKLEENTGTSSTDIRSFYRSSWVSATTVHYKCYIYRCLAEGFSRYLSVLLCNMERYASEMEALTFIQKKLKNISEFSSPSSYNLNEYFRGIVSFTDQRPSVSYEPVTVYDNLVPKLEAWRSALHLVLMVLQSDAEIITGSAPHTKMAKADFVTNKPAFL
ncbi:Bardet-Biedl syndrome 12 protein [Hyperolius riggenbachi]|uniref:Bardet-Biedl syndrome 12 protein n=1 Tax=Hyperolius riggenbachi TaxID=752182 RepID=UPI0035A3B518